MSATHTVRLWVAPEPCADLSGYMAGADFAVNMLELALEISTIADCGELFAWVESQGSRGFAARLASTYSMVLLLPGLSGRRFADLTSAAPSVASRGCCLMSVHDVLLSNDYLVHTACSVSCTTLSSSYAALLRE